MVSLSKDDKKRAERRALCENRCHNPEEHKEKDSWQICANLEARYIKEEKNMPKDFQVRQGYPAPSLEELKPFIRFVPGFYNIIGNKIPSNNSRDLERVNGIIKDRAKEKYNFIVADFKRTMVAFWI
ncbi:hypothetical protein BDV06DRAFT_216593 [Aspergillus oleicola]